MKACLTASALHRQTVRYGPATELHMSYVTSCLMASGVSNNIRSAYERHLTLPTASKSINQPNDGQSGDYGWPSWSNYWVLRQHSGGSVVKISVPRGVTCTVHDLEIMGLNPKGGPWLDGSWWPSHRHKMYCPWTGRPWFKLHSDRTWDVYLSYLNQKETHTQPSLPLPSIRFPPLKMSIINGNNDKSTLNSMRQAVGPVKKQCSAYIYWYKTVQCELYTYQNRLYRCLHTFSEAQRRPSMSLDFYPCLKLK